MPWPVQGFDLFLFLFLLSASGSFCIFFFNDTATTEIYTLSLHDALPISRSFFGNPSMTSQYVLTFGREALTDRKSTRLNSSHHIISYAVFCLKKKNPARDDPGVRSIPALLDSTGRDGFCIPIHQTAETFP